MHYKMQNMHKIIMKQVCRICTKICEQNSGVQNSDMPQCIFSTPHFADVILKNQNYDIIVQVFMTSELAYNLKDIIVMTSSAIS
jgi:hypothetical protein